MIATGLPASPGAAVGKIAFTAEEAEQRVARRREDHPRPPRDRAGRHRRHARLRGHPDQHRRHDVATRRSSPAAWARPASPARAWSRSTPHNKTADDRRQDLRPERLDQPRRRHQPARCTKARCRRVEAALSGAFAQIMKWADKYPHAEGPHERRHAARCGGRPRTSAPKASA